MPHSTPPLEEYRVLLKNGFLPDRLPLQRLQNPCYEPWESIADDLPSRIQAGTLRSTVDILPVLSPSSLNDEAEWRRAYVVLAYLTHAYVWGGEKPQEILPPCISIPFLEISKRLELPACATYSAVCLWNFSLKPEQTDPTRPEKLSVNTSFTGTQDEEWFFMVSVAIEAKGAAVIAPMIDAIHAVSLDNPETVITALSQISNTLQALSKILQRMYEKCGPSVFFHVIRPFLAGGKNMAAAGLPDGIFYDIGDGRGKWHQYSGGSNAQSSLIQAFDAFLDVRHTATGGITKPGSEHHQHAAKPASYLQEMRNYMPGPHRRFLEHLSQVSNVREYAMRHDPGSPVRNAYNTLVLSLTSFRDKHIQLVSRYIIMASSMKMNLGDVQSRGLAASTMAMAKTAQSSGSDVAANAKEKNRAAPVGTGGTDLIPFLKKTRDTTRIAAS